MVKQHYSAGKLRILILKAGDLSQDVNMCEFELRIEQWFLAHAFEQHLGLRSGDRRHKAYSRIELRGRINVRFGEIKWVDSCFRGPRQYYQSSSCTKKR